MRFITEFQLIQPVTDSLIDAHKSGHEQVLGMRIAETFNWKEKREGGKSGFSLEIEAFPMDKWIEFKKRFADALPDYDTVSRTRLINAMADLESYPKPDHYEQAKTTK